jgi:hypothetical protein
MLSACGRPEGSRHSDLLTVTSKAAPAPAPARLFANRLPCGRFRRPGPDFVNGPDPGPVAHRISVSCWAACAQGMTSPALPRFSSMLPAERYTHKPSSYNCSTPAPGSGVSSACLVHVSGMSCARGVPDSRAIWPFWAFSPPSRQRYLEALLIHLRCQCANLARMGMPLFGCGNGSEGCLGEAPSAWHPRLTPGLHPWR